jgi:hypothetical protein
MRESALALATGVAIVTACASVAPYGASAPGATASAKGTLYCWKDRLVEQSDKLECNWAPTRYEACNGHAFTYVDKRLVTSQPSAATRCENGQSLVTVTTG